MCGRRYHSMKSSPYLNYVIIIIINIIRPIIITGRPIMFDNPAV